MATNTKGSLRVAKKVRAGIQSTFDRVRDVFIAIFEALVALGVTLEEVAMLAGDTGLEKRTKIIGYIRDTIRGVKHDLSAAVLAKLGLIEEATDITPPPGGKVFRVLVMVDWRMKWKEYILASCPQTPKDSDILYMGDQFESPSRDSEIKEIIFLWFGKNVYGTVEKAVAWATTNNLTNGHGRIPAAVIGGIPGIIGQLQNLGYQYASVGIVSTSQCVLREDYCLPSAWQYDGGERKADLDRVSDEWYGNRIFTFVPK